MNKREMKKRIFGEYAGFISDSSYNQEKRPLEQRMNELLYSMCKFKEPSRSQKNRFSEAKIEVWRIIMHHAGFK